MVFGRACHVSILEPEVFTEKYKRGPEGDRRTKAVRATWEDAEDKYGKDFVLKPDDFDKCVLMRASVRSKRTAQTLLGGEGDAEVSVLWDEDGTLSRARADRMSWELKGGTIVDLKTTTDARVSEFERRIFQFGYHRQGAWYLRGFRTQVAVNHYAIIAVEKEPPFGVGVYRLTDEALDAGWQQIEPLLDLYRECVEKNDWPGYPDEVKDIGLPSWAWDKMEEVTPL